MSNKQPALLGIFITVFIDLVAFGMFIPDIQLRARLFSGEGIGVGFTLASFSLAQFIFSPILGRISDKIGRRPVLLVTTSLAAVSFLIYAHVNTLALLVLSRIVCGIAASNISVAYAYISDISTKENRTKFLGKIGAAFAAGFICGFPLGFLLLHLGNNQPYLLGYTAATFSFINFLYIYFILPESKKNHSSDHEMSFNPISNILKYKQLLPVFGIYFLGALAIIMVDTTFMQYAVHHIKITQLQTGFILFTLGISSGLMNGIGVQKLTNHYSNQILVITGMPIMAFSFILLPYATPWIPLIMVILALGLSRTLIDTSIVGIISKSIPQDMQGGILGITLSLQSMARIIGPPIGNYLLGSYPPAPYIFSGIIVLINMLFFNALYIRGKYGKT